jgi:hypothetical protein
VSNPVNALEVIPVRRRLMKAVFFLSDESREFPILRMSARALNTVICSAGDGAHLSRRPKRAH